MFIIYTPTSFIYSQLPSLTAFFYSYSGREIVMYHPPGRDEHGSRGRDPTCVMDQIACIGFVSSAGYWVGLMCKVCAADGGKSCTQVTDPEIKYGI